MATDEVSTYGSFVLLTAKGASHRLQGYENLFVSIPPLCSNLAEKDACKGHQPYRRWNPICAVRTGNFRGEWQGKFRLIFNKFDLCAASICARCSHRYIDDPCTARWSQGGCWDAKIVLGRTNAHRRNCKNPTVDELEANFSGDKVKLTWVAGMGGKKKDSEMFTILRIFPDPTSQSTP